MLNSADNLPLIPEVCQPDQTPIVASGGERTLHRVAEIRRRQNVSLRSVARRMGKPLDQVRDEERADTDMPLSELYRWQQSLGVPIAELLVDQDESLSEPILSRARLLRIMKTVRAIREAYQEMGDNDERVARLAQMLEEQLIELMPELKDVAPWHAVGQRRTQHELGRAADRPLPETFFTDPG